MTKRLTCVVAMKAQFGYVLSACAAETPACDVRLFGPFEAKVNGEALPRLRSRKGQWLLALLVLRDGRPVERAWLAGTLWPETTEEKALVSLRQTLADLRQAMGGRASGSCPPRPGRWRSTRRVRP